MPARQNDHKIGSKIEPYKADKLKALFGKEPKFPRSKTELKNGRKPR